MAVVVNTISDRGTDSKVSMYHRTLALNIDCGSDVIRELIKKNLSDRGTTLQAHIRDVAVQNKVRQLRQRKVLNRDQIALLNATPPDLNRMDITLLSAMALEIFSFTSTVQSNIKSLRNTRNEIIHQPKTQLEDDSLLRDSERFVIDLAGEVNTDIVELFRKRIDDLKMRELVKTRTNLEIIILHGESLMVKLVETDGTENADDFSDVMIKHRLTQWVRYLSRAVEVDILLQKLTENAIIDEQRKKCLGQLYNYEEQMYCLILYMMSADREKLLKFTVCLRELNSHAADIIEGRENMEKDFAKKLKLMEKERMKTILSSALETKTRAYVACEDVHIFIEEERKCPIKFDDVIDGIKGVFPDVNFEENDSQFHGIAWKDETKQYGIDQIEESEDNISDMSCEQFAEYLAATLEKVKVGIGDAIKATVLEEVLSSKIFASLTIEQLKEIFTPGLESVSTKFATGIKMTFQKIQQQIENQCTHTIHSLKGSLRIFDSPTRNLIYKPGIVIPETGNLIVPAHEFVLPSSRQCNNAFIAKCIVRFASACINGKKNGTIHFGIKDRGKGQGEIIGLSKEIDVDYLRNEIQYAIKSCFNVLNVERCIRPIQSVPVEENGVVLEVDVVPRACHVDKELIQVRFPPKGNQRKKCFVYSNIENQIVTIEDSKFELIKNEFESLHSEREQLDKLITTPDKGGYSQKRLKLRKALTGGAKFVTDAFVPVICCGEITGCQDEDNIRQLLAKMDVAFTSSTAVLDFDSSVSLRNLIEKDKHYFRIKLAEDYTTDRPRRDSGVAVEDCVWLYTNGNKEHEKEKLTSEKWFERRLIGVKSALANIRQMIPRGRGLLVFLVFQKTIDYDPMLEIAREAFTSTFVNECIIIAENDNILGDWMKELHGKVNKLHEKVFVGLEWQDTVSEIAYLFKPKEDRSFKFPDSRGNIVKLNPKERDELNFQDIELVDCGFIDRFLNLEIECMPIDDVKEKRTVEEREYYKGNIVTWWNLYYKNQVCRREVYETHKERIRKILESNDGEERYEGYCIDHHPGAGGTTLGRQLLWHFSQIKPGRVREAYRCCIINKITKDTAEEIDRFRSFHENSSATPKPVIALIDNGNEELINTLKVSLDEVSYKKGSPNKLFCLLIYITRVSISKSDKRFHILEQRLSINDKIWFEKKFQDLQNDGVKVNTLFAFNVLRNSFDASFIDETTARLMEEVYENELKVLQSLSLICSFDNDHPVPESVFDSVMDAGHAPNKLSLHECIGKPFGLVWLQREREARRKENRETWNVHLTEAMQLFVTHRPSDKFCGNAVSVLSQPLANAIIRYIITERSTTFEDIVDQLLDLVETHCFETNTMSKEFVKNVCSLFKTRVELVDDKGGTKQGRFSSLILELEKPVDTESSDDSQKRVVRIMGRCMEVTKDPFVGQQLARYLYHTKDYDAAENAIKRSLEKLPHNSYLLDTYGQIFRSKMDYMIGLRKKINLTDADTVEFITLALNAADKFKLAQKEASFSDEDKNLNCYLMEVQTILCLLENFQRFDCFVSRENFWNFLNDPEFSIKGSSFEHILQSIPEFKQFRNGNAGHEHLEQSLRNLEENRYMTRAHCLTQFTVPNNDPLLLGPREKFEYFYGSKEHTLNFEFMKGVGLKLLMKAHEKDKQLLRNRVMDALCRLQHNAHKGTPHGKVLEENDLLVYIGHSIIVLSNGEDNCNSGWYKNLLKYSMKLLAIQRNKRPSSRKYIEAYLYYALLHWNLPERHFVESHPTTLKTVIEEWENVYMKNLNVKSRDQLFKKKPKIYFALGIGPPGDDIVDEECLRLKWREEKRRKDGRKRKEVRADNHWYHPIFEERHRRLSGIVDDTGRTIQTKIFYKGHEYPFHIHANDDCSAFSNRSVTFVLGFSWMSPTALDVRRDVPRGNGNARASTGSNQGAIPKTFKATVSKTSAKHKGPDKLQRHKHHRDEKELKLKNYSSSPTSEIGACGASSADFIKQKIQQEYQNDAKSVPAHKEDGGYQATGDNGHKTKSMSTSSVGKQPIKSKTRMKTDLDDLD